MNHLIHSLLLAAALILASCQSIPEPQKDSEIQRKTREDLRFIQKQIRENHPGPVMKTDPAFSGWLEKGLPEAEAMIPKVVDENGRNFVIKFYLAGFKDTHTFVHRALGPSKTVKWPGFYIALDGARPAVFYRAFVDKWTGSELPPLGATVFSCDGKSPLELVSKNLLPFSSDAPVESTFVDLMPQLLLDTGNPFVQMPRSCKIIVEGKKKTFNLAWQEVDTMSAFQISNLMSGGFRAPMSIEEFEPKKFWLSIPTFQPNAMEITVLKAMYARSPDFKSANLIVIDLRGNHGGNPKWGYDLLTAMFGEHYANRLVEHSSYSSLTSYRRASVANREDYLKSATQMDELFGSESDPSQTLRKFAIQQFTALATNQELVEYSTDGKPPSRPKFPIHAKLALITDSACTSACLMIAESLLATGKVIHLGGETSADGAYTEGRQVPMPDGNGYFQHAKLASFFGSRKPNTSFVPFIKWRHSPQTKEQLREFVLNSLDSKKLVGLRK